MRCAEFRKRFHRMLDANQPRIFSGQMSDHLGSCPACAAHVRDMEIVDTALRNAPDIEIPDDLEKKLLAIPDLYTAELQRPAWNREILRATIYVVPVALMAILCLTFGPDFRFALQAGFATLAFLAIVLQRMRRTSKTA
jgi:anti-sigma factor RsiW